MCPENIVINSLYAISLLGTTHKVIENTGDIIVRKLLVARALDKQLVKKNPSKYSAMEKFYSDMFR